MFKTNKSTPHFQFQGTRGLIAKPAIKVDGRFRFCLLGLARARGEARTFLGGISRTLMSSCRNFLLDLTPDFASRILFGMYVNVCITFLDFVNKHAKRLSGK